MDSEEKHGPTYFNRVFRHGVDEKRRVAVPAAWRPEQPGVELTLVVWPKAKEGVCLRVLLPEKMADLVREMDALPNSDPGKVPLKRFIARESAQVALDKAGRICLPENMAKVADIKGEAVMAGMLDKWEIWSPERYELLSKSDEAIAQEAFIRLME